MDTTIRNLDEQAYRRLRARAVLEGRTVGDLLNEAMQAYLVRTEGRHRRGSSLRDLQPEPFPEGNEEFPSGFLQRKGWHHATARVLMEQFLAGLWAEDCAQGQILSFDEEFRKVSGLRIQSNRSPLMDVRLEVSTAWASELMKPTTYSIVARPFIGEVTGPSS